MTETVIVTGLVREANEDPGVILDMMLPPSHFTGGKVWGGGCMIIVSRCVSYTMYPVLSPLRILYGVGRC